MAKITAVSETSVTVQFDDGKTKDLPLAACQGFMPLPGMEVEVVLEGDNFILKQVLNSNFNNTSASDEPRPFVATDKEKVKVNKIVYLLLAFFLGAFGIHRFFAGRVTSGVIYLLCSTVGAIIIIPPFIIIILVIIDFVKAVMSPADANGNIEM